MAMSGMKVEPEVQLTYNDMNLRHTQKFALFRIDKDRGVVHLDKEIQPGPSGTFDDFLSLCKLDDVFYAVYDIDRVLPEGRPFKKLAFVFWCPDEAPVKKKMLYASSLDTVKKACTGVGIVIQAKEQPDIDEGIVDAMKKA